MIASHDPFVIASNGSDWIVSGLQVCHRSAIAFSDRMNTSDEPRLLARITTDPAIFGGKPVVRGRRLAVEHVLEMLAVGDSEQEILAAYPWLEPDDLRACLLYAARAVGNEHVEPLSTAERG